MSRPIDDTLVLPEGVSLPAVDGAVQIRVYLRAEFPDADDFPDGTYIAALDEGNTMYFASGGEWIAHGYGINDIPDNYVFKSVNGVPMWYPLFGATVSGDYTELILGLSPIAWYRCNDIGGGLIDSIGNFHLDLGNGGLNFGNDSLVPTDPSSSVSTTDDSTWLVYNLGEFGLVSVSAPWSIGGWVNLTTLGVFGNAVASYIAFLAFDQNQANGRAHGIRINLDGSLSAANANAAYVSTTPGVISAGVLQHIMVTRDDLGIARFYVNGVLIHSTPMLAGDVNYDVAGPWLQLNGGFDEVDFYDYVLTGPQVLNIYNTGVGA